MPVSGEMSAKLVIGVDDALARARLQGFAGVAKTSFGTMEKDFAATTAKMRANAESLTAIGSTMAMAGAAGVAAMVPMVKSAMDLDQALRNVNSIAKGGEQGYKDMRKAILDIAKDPQITDMPVELANGLYQIYSSGLQGKIALDALRISAKGAMAGMTDTATSSRVLVAAMNAYGGKSAKDAAHYMDAFFKTVELGVLDFPQLANGIGNVMGMAAQLKIPIETVGAAIATMTRRGVGADEAFTSLNRVFGEVLSPSKLMQDALKGTGHESWLAALQADGLAGVMDHITTAAGGNQAAIATMLGEVRAARGVFNMSGDAAALFADMLTQMQAAAGASGAAATEQMKGAVNEWKKMMQELNVSGQNTGTALYKSFAPVMELITGVIKGANKLAETTFGKVALPVVGYGTAGAVVAGGGMAAWGAAARTAAAIGETAPGSKGAMAMAWVARRFPWLAAAGIGVAAALHLYNKYGGGSGGQAEKPTGGRARGGRIGGSDIAWVGEEGPELAVARGGGVDIIPLSKVPGFAGGGTVGYDPRFAGQQAAREAWRNTVDWPKGGPGIGEQGTGWYTDRAGASRVVPPGETFRQRGAFAQPQGRGWYSGGREPWVAGQGRPIGGSTTIPGKPSWWQKGADWVSQQAGRIRTGAGVATGASDAEALAAGAKTAGRFGKGWGGKIGGGIGAVGSAYALPYEIQGSYQQQRYGGGGWSWGGFGGAVASGAAVGGALGAPFGGVGAGPGAGIGAVVGGVSYVGAGILGLRERGAPGPTGEAPPMAPLPGSAEARRQWRPNTRWEAPTYPGAGTGVQVRGSGGMRMPADLERGFSGMFGKGRWDVGAAKQRTTTEAFMDRLRGRQRGTTGRAAISYGERMGIGSVTPATAGTDYYNAMMESAQLNRRYGGGGAGGIDPSYNSGMGTLAGGNAVGGWSVAQERAGAAEEQPAWMQEALAREQGVIGGGGRPTFKPSNVAELGWAGAGQGRRPEGGMAGERARARERIRKGGSSDAALSGRLADLPGIMQGIGGGAEDNLQQRMMNAGGLRGMVGGVSIGRGAGGGLDMLTQGEGTGMRGGRGGDRPLIGEINITVQGSIYGDQRLHTIIKQDIHDAVRDAVLMTGPVGAG